MYTYAQATSYNQINPTPSPKDILAIHLWVPNVTHLTFYIILYDTITSKHSPLEIVRAGDHCDLKISKQMLPLLFMFG